MPDALRIALLGAESTGKTTLAAALAPHIAAETGLRTAWVSETLREWCERQGRTPLVHEQASLLRLHHDRIGAAAAEHDVVICDTTALMTAVYSRIVFGDRSLDERAAALHRGMSATLLTALDLPWVADGLQREGPHVRGPVDTLIRELLATHHLPWSLVTGQGPARLDHAMGVLAPLLHERATGRFTRPGMRSAGTRAQRWTCDCCPVPAATAPNATPAAGSRPR